MDIDSDFCIEKGPQLFKYLNEKYGKENCCNIMTFGRLQPKAVIKDIAKVLDIPYAEVNEFTGQLPSAAGIDISINTLLTDPEYCNMPFIKKYPELFKHAKLLEGSPRHVSQHAAGIAITPKPVYEIAPVYYGKDIELGNGEVFRGNRSQVEKEQCESLGIIKLDLLKLKNVTELEKEIEEINRIYGKNITLEDIPLDDKLTWKAFQQCNTLGVFQFASNVALPVLKKMQCSNIEELAAANSLIRPGTGGLDDYCKGKKDPGSIKKIDKRLSKCLEPTYGAIIFQEQIMFLISELMGISFGQADIYRRALEKMHKPANKAKVDYFNENAVKLAVERGIPEEDAEYIKKMILDNCGYAFNKSHAVCYSYISYYTAYMKIHYPLIFHKTMLNGNLGNLSEFIDMARTEKVTLNPPHINYSVFTTEIENEQDKVLRIGFNALKGVGEKAVEDIKAARPFKSVNDYLERIGKAGKNKKVVQTLIKFGTFDGLRVEVNYNCLNTGKLEEQGINFNENGILLNRKQLMKWYECYLEYKSQTKMPCYDVPATMIKNKYIEKYQLKQESSGTYTIPITMLSMMEIKEDSVKKSRRIPKGLLKEIVQNTTAWADPMTRPFTNNLQDISKLLIDNKQIYLEEMEENEFSFVEHPLNQFVTGMTNFKEAKDGELCIEAGIMTFLEKRKSKNNKDYYWLTIRTPRESVRITLWNNQFEKYKSFIKKNALVKVKGVKGYGGMGCEIMQPLKNQY